MMTRSANQLLWISEDVFLERLKAGIQAWRSFPVSDNPLLAEFWSPSPADVTRLTAFVQFCATHVSAESEPAEVQMVYPLVKKK